MGIGSAGAVTGSNYGQHAGGVNAPALANPQMADVDAGGPGSANSASEFVDASALASATAGQVETPGSPSGVAFVSEGAGGDGLGRGNGNGNGNGNSGQSAGPDVGYDLGNSLAYNGGNGGGAVYGVDYGHALGNVSGAHRLDGPDAGSSWPMTTGPASPASNGGAPMPSSVAYGTAPAIAGTTAYQLSTSASAAAIARPGLQSLPGLPPPLAVVLPAHYSSDAVLQAVTRPAATPSTAPASAQGGLGPHASALTPNIGAGAGAAAQRLADTLAASLQAVGRPGLAQAAASAQAQIVAAASPPAAATALGAPGVSARAGLVAVPGATPQTAVAPALSLGEGTKPASAIAGSTSGTASSEALVRARITAAAAGVAATLSATSSANASSNSGPGAASAEGAEPWANPLLEASGRRARNAQVRPSPKAHSGNRLDRVEAVSRHMEGRRLWDEYDAEDADEEAAPDAAPADADASLTDEFDRASNRYRQLVGCLRASGQDVAMRELAQQRRVLLLAPRDGAGEAWTVHLLCPTASSASGVHAAGVSGQAWPLRAEGAWALDGPAAQWQRWRMRQQMRADGVWMLDQADLGQRQPAWCVDGHAAALPVPTEGEIPLRLTEPRRLRRLLGAQWTLLVLRAPAPLPGRAGDGMPRGAW